MKLKLAFIISFGRFQTKDVRNPLMVGRGKKIKSAEGIFGALIITN
jgi:hypothetical protein